MEGLLRRVSDKMLSKWEPRSRLGFYLGHSPYHTGSVALVLNPRTLHVSPQFHVVFDDYFTTVPYLSHDTPQNWTTLLQKAEDVSEENYNLVNTWLDSQENLSQSLLHQEGDMKDIVQSENNKSISFNSQHEENNSYTQSISHIDPDGDSNYSQMLEPTLPNINKLISRRSTRTKNPSIKAILSY